MSNIQISLTTSEFCRQLGYTLAVLLRYLLHYYIISSFLNIIDFFFIIGMKWREGWETA
jgi:hypothetical protein